jgi:hypothetical protein
MRVFSQEVYEICKWFPGGSTMSTREDTDAPDRWEFVGRRARDVVRELYRFKAVHKYFQHGARNPICYANLDKDLTRKLS